jgi:hypothetical protein
MSGWAQRDAERKEDEALEAEERRGMPDTFELLAVMREVRDASSFDLNPHERSCPQPSIVCGCSRSRRHIAAWEAFHAALRASGVPSLADIEREARGTP